MSAGGSVVHLLLLLLLGEGGGRCDEGRMRAGARAPSLRLLLVAGQLTFLIATSAAVFENERRDNAAAAAAETEAALI